MKTRFQIRHLIFILLPFITCIPLIASNNPAKANFSPQTAWTLYASDTTLIRRGMAAAPDAKRQVIVLFGGFNDQGKEDHETWEFNGASWQQKNPAHSPSARFWHGMAYDSQRQVVVLFGGRNEQGTHFNDTWEYDGVDWKQVTPAHAPTNRTGFGMTYDSCRHKVVLFGGGETPQGTWEYDGTDWQESAVSAHPQGLFLTAMAFDPTRCRTVLFGGDGGSATGSNETWEYDGVNWALITTTKSPMARWGHTLAFYPARGKTVLFGGYGPSYPSGTPQKDTWEFDGTNWVETSPLISPPANEQQILVYAEKLKKVLLFGGFGSGETWLYSNDFPIYLPVVVGHS